VAAKRFWQICPQVGQKGVFVLKIWAAILLLALIAVGVTIAVVGLCITVFANKDRRG
jgi:hypothetical protein